MAPRPPIAGPPTPKWVTRARRFAQITILVGLFAVDGPIHAGDRVTGPADAATAVTLHWNAPSECPPVGYVRAEIGRLLAGSGTPTRRLDVVAKVARIPAGTWRVRLLTRRDGDVDSGERSLDAESCRALADASALILALAVDPARVAANQAASAGSAESGEPAKESDGGPGDGGALNEGGNETSEGEKRGGDAGDAGANANLQDDEDAKSERAAASYGAEEPGPASDEFPPAPSAATRPSRFLVGTAVAGDFGNLPYPGVGLSIFFAWTPSPLRLEMAASYFPPNHSPVVEGTTLVSFQLYAVDVHGCFDLIASVRGAFSRFFLGPCGGAEVAYVAGVSEGVSPAGSGSTLLFSLDADALIAWRLSGAFEIQLRLDARVPLARPEFLLQDRATIDTNSVHRPAVVTGRGVFGAALRF